MTVADVMLTHPAISAEEADLLRLLEDATALEHGVTREQLSEDLHAFTVHFWNVVEPAADFTDNWHIRELCDVLMRCERREPGYTRVIINVPPGTMKSLLVNVFFPAWCWARTARRRFLTFSHSQHLSMRDNVRFRTLVRSREFQALFPFKLEEDQNTKTRINTDQRGWRIASSVMGAGIGEHPHFTIIDDPITAVQAESDTERQAVADWFDTTVSTRGIILGVVIIVIMQRLHEEDLTGHLLKKGGWTHVRWPMRFERCTCPPGGAQDEQATCILHRADKGWVPDPRDPRTEDGELLFPQRFDEEAVKQLETDLGPDAAGQLQQRPSAMSGGWFKREWFKIVDAGPTIARTVRGWDTAGTENDGDYTVGAKVSEEWALLADPQNPARAFMQPTGRIFVEDVVRDQLAPDGVDALMLATARLDGKAVAQREEREGGASGKSTINARAKLLAGHDYKEVQLGANKRVRGKPFRSRAAAGHVHLVRGPWNQAFINELCALWTGTYDDQMDATSAAYNAIVDEPAPRQDACTW